MNAVRRYCFRSSETDGVGRLGNSAVLHKDLLRTLRPASIRRPFFGAAEGLVCLHITYIMKRVHG